MGAKMPLFSLKRARIFKLITFFVFLFIFSSCASKRPVVNPKVQLSNLTVQDITLSHINYGATISVYNPNLSDIDIDYIQYEIFLNNLKFMDGAEQLDVTVPAHSKKEIQVTLSGSLFNVLQLLSELARQPKINFEMKGHLTGDFGAGERFSLPFKETGSLDLKKLDPGIPLR